MQAQVSKLMNVKSLRTSYYFNLKYVDIPNVVTPSMVVVALTP
jgi:hypothetical protein